MTEFQDQQTQANDVTETTNQRSYAEWTTFLISSGILLSLVALVLYDWFLMQQSPAILEVEPQAVIEINQQQYYQPFVVKNVGGSVAESVQVVASLSMGHSSTSEVGEQEIPFLAAGEDKSGYFVFSHNPSQGELRLRVASYR